MIYLASPYSHPVFNVMEDRYYAAQLFTARAMTEGHVIFSPIVYGHHIALNSVLPTDALYWRQFNETIIQACSLMWVLRLDGWEQSKGVKMEIEFANDIGLTVEYKDL